MKFDTYTLQARVLPAFFFTAPFFFEANYIIFTLGFEVTISATITNILLFAFLMFLANFVRYLGRKKESVLFKEWDGAPTVRFLRYSNSEYNEFKKNEIRTYLKMMFNHLSMPSEEDEKKDLEKCDKQYEAYIINLRALTRDTKEFPLLQAENRSYGMLRNLYGIKTLSIISISVLILLNVCLCLFFPYIMPLITCVIINAIFGALLLLWIIIVSKNKIKDIANCYAERLLETVTLLNENRGNKTKNKK